MKSDDNWKETRLLAEDLQNLIGLPSKVTEDYLKIIENLLIHKFLEVVMETDDFKGKDCQIELPYLGSLVISVDDKDKLHVDFTVRNIFYRKLKSAYYNRESPLTEQLEKILGQELVQRFEEGGSILDEQSTDSTTE